MRILLIGNYPPDRQQSMLRFATLLQRELEGLRHQVTLLQPRPILTKILQNKWLGYIDKFLLFPWRLRRHLRQCDLAHICDHSNALYTRHLAGVPTVVTCHDVLAIRSALGEIPENPVSRSGRILQRRILQGLRRATFIVCDSDASQQDMLRVTGRPPHGSAVVYLSLNYPYSPLPRAHALDLLKRAGVPAQVPCFLHVGGDAWYKNRLTLLRIFAELRTLSPEPRNLLLIGDPLSPAQSAFVAQHGLAEHVHQLSGVDNETVAAAYSLALCLIFPSLQEGFGWPVIEAQACACPVFASDRAPMTEIGGPAAHYFDPEQPARAAHLIHDQLPSRPGIEQAGLKNLQRFSTDQMVQGYLQAYERAKTKGAQGRSPTPPNG